jgi:hypothetical protein
MFTSAHLLTNFSSESNYPHVIITNGSIIPTIGSGLTQLFSKQIEVTVVPEFKANLLSISKCTIQLDCNVIFISQKIIFQDRASGRTIGEGRLIDGLYVIQSDALELSTIKISSSQLWHRRLDHPLIEF